MMRKLLTALLLVSCVSIAGCGAPPAGDRSAVTDAGSARTGATLPATTDVAFAQDAVERLLNGDLAVEAALDWEHLRVPGGDVGADYREIPDEGRQASRKEFIERFSASFKETGASVSSLQHWREQSRSPEATTIIADAPSGKTVSITVSRKDGQQKVSEIAVR